MFYLGEQYCQSLLQTPLSFRNVPDLSENSQALRGVSGIRRERIGLFAAESGTLQEIKGV